MPLFITPRDGYLNLLLSMSIHLQDGLVLNQKGHCILQIFIVLNVDVTSLSSSSLSLWSKESGVRPGSRHLNIRNWVSPASKSRYY